MKAPPARRYVQIGVPAAVALLFIVPVWLNGRTAGLPASGGAALTDAGGSVRQEDMPLPRITGPTLTGGSFDPGTLRGKVVVMNVWNPDCPPCRQEAPTLAASWRALRGRSDVAMLGLMFVGPAWPDDRPAARRFVSDEGLTYPTVVDAGSRVANALAIPGIPVTVIADPSGRVRYLIVGRARAGQIQMLVSRLAPAGDYTPAS